jgi:hypothetical protein
MNQNKNIFTAAMMQKNIPDCGACSFMYAHCFDYTIYGSEECIENIKRHLKSMKGESDGENRDVTAVMPSRPRDS